MAAIAVPRTGPGRPRCRPDRMISDKAPQLEGDPPVTAGTGHRRDRQAGRGRPRLARRAPGGVRLKPSTSGATWSSAASTGSSSGGDLHPVRRARPRLQGGGRAGHRLVLDQCM